MTVCCYFSAFGIKEGSEEGYLEVRKTRRGSDYRMVNKTMRSLGGGHFKGVLTQVRKNNDWTCLRQR